MTLHTTSDAQHLSRCLPLLTADHALLLLGSAARWSPELPSPAAVAAPVYALKEDLEMLAITPPPGVMVIDYNDWLTLTEAHVQHVHWR